MHPKQPRRTTAPARSPEVRAQEERHQRPANQAPNVSKVVDVHRYEPVQQVDADGARKRVAVGLHVREQLRGREGCDRHVRVQRCQTLLALSWT